MTHASLKSLKKKTWEGSSQISWIKFFVRSIRLMLALIPRWGSAERDDAPYLFFPNTTQKNFLDATSRINDMSINPPTIIDERDLYPEEIESRIPPA